MDTAYVLTATDKTGTEDTLTVVFGVYSSREKATNAVLYWMFEGNEKAEDYSNNRDCEEYVTDKNIWRIETFEVDIVD